MITDPNIIEMLNEMNSQMSSQFTTTMAVLGLMAVLITLCWFWK